MKLFHTLLSHYQTLLEQPRKCFIEFSAGAVIFFIGMALLFICEHFIVASVKQELLMLMSLAVALCGFLLGFPAYLCFIISRFKNM